MNKFMTGLRFGAGALCVLGLNHAALAADAALPVKAPIVAATSYNWTGIYGGVHLGYGVGMKDWTNSSFDFDVKGFLGGGQIGVNQQIGNWVIGIEADASWASIKGSQTLTIGDIGVPVIGLSATATASTTIDRIVTLAGRIGFAQDRWLAYAKLGAAWVHENHSFALTQTQTIVGAGTITQTGAATGSENRFGPMIGFGAEHALWGNWSVKSEYNYIYLPNGTASLVGIATAAGVTTPFAVNSNIQQSLHLVKFGLNYRFGPDAPPAIAPARPAPGYNWTGYYVGAQAGYGFGRKEWENFGADGRFNVGGGLAGVVTGTNVQAGAFVFGVESEWMWTGIKGSTRFGLTVPGLGSQTTELSSKFDWLSIASLRAGFIAADRWLVYLKSGVAVARESHALGFAQSIVGVGSVVANLSGSALHTGYLAGIGVEHAFLGNWSAKLEYNYIAFRSQDVTISGLETANIPGTAVGTIAFFQRNAIREQMHLVKLGVNYHFNALPDVISVRY